MLAPTRDLPLNIMESPAADEPEPLLSGRQRLPAVPNQPFQRNCQAAKRMLDEPAAPLFSGAVIQHRLNANIQPTTNM
jgi:hypothetical protein